MESIKGSLIGSIDEGTSSARFFIFEAETGRVVTSHQQEISQKFPEQGWVEQDPIEILNAVNLCIHESIKNLEELGGSVKDIVAIGITNQRESTIVWDKNTGLPLYNSIVWLDTRTTSTVDQLLDTVPNKSRNNNYLKPLCGLPIATYFSALKLKWLKDYIPSVKKAIEDGRCLFGTVDTWLIWNLTGGIQGGIHITDVTNASRTMLMNIRTLKWDPTLLQFFSISQSVLPDIKSSSEVYAHIKGGPLDGLPLSGCLGDQQAALVGQHCFSRGEAKNTYGTGCFLLYNTGTAVVESAHGLLTTVAYQFGSKEPPVYALEGSVAIAGAALTWLRDNMGVFNNFHDVEGIAKEAELNDNGNIYFVPAFSGLFAPYWRQDARGVLCGITEDTKACHLVRATLEAVCYQIRDILEAMNNDCGVSLSTLKVDGGMTANSLLMQLQADICGITIVKPEMAESTALGAAMAAGAAVGVWKLPTPLTTDAAKVWEPSISDNERDVKYSGWKNAVECSMGWNI